MEQILQNFCPASYRLLLTVVSASIPSQYPLHTYTMTIFSFSNINTSRVFFPSAKIQSREENIKKLDLLVVTLFLLYRGFLVI